MKTTKNKIAIELFHKGFNCSQAVLLSFGEELGLDKQTCLKIACAFGGGMAKQQSICGAVTSAYMVLGLKYGKFKEEDNISKETTFSLVHKFNEKFIELNGSIICREIIGEDMNTDAGKKRIQENDLFKVKCEKAISDAVDILNELI